MKRKVDAKFIAACLPDAPKGYSHRVEKVSATIWRVALVHPDRYTYKEGVTTTWGAVKGNAVYRAYNGKLGEKVCDLLDAGELSGYSCIIPAYTELKTAGM